MIKIDFSSKFSSSTKYFTLLLPGTRSISGPARLFHNLYTVGDYSCLSVLIHPRKQVYIVQSNPLYLFCDRHMQIHSRQKYWQKEPHSWSFIDFWTPPTSRRVACVAVYRIVSSEQHFGYYFQFHFRVLLQSEKGTAVHSLCETSCLPRTVHFLRFCP